MSEESAQFTIEEFYKFVNQGRLMGARCKRCRELLTPPRPMCPKCLSKDLEFKELPKQGKLLTYTIIHVSPKRFQKLTPYAVGIVKLEEGAQLPGIIRHIGFDRIKIGMSLAVNFDKKVDSEDWPQWTRYYFRPIEDSATL
jgi:uncharacterized OB-fold protein